MLRLVLTPRGLLGLVILAGVDAGCGWLGDWQWSKGASAHGDLRNSAYGLQWWVFGLVAIWFYRKVLLEPTRSLPLETTTPGQLWAAAATAAQPAAAGDPRRAPDASPAAEEADPDVVAWNAWLAQLNAAPRR